MEGIWYSIIGNPAPRYFYYSPPFPNPITCIRDIATTGWKEFYYRFIPWNGREWIAATYKDTVGMLSSLDVSIILLPMIVAVLLTLIRRMFDQGLKRLYNVIGVEGESRQKLAGIIWRILIYSWMWAWSVKLLFFDGEDYFFAMGKHYQWWYGGASIPFSSYLLMVLEMGFYLHSICNTLYLDTVKKEHCFTLIHYCLMYILILTAYVIRLHIHAILIFFLMDLSNILLDMSDLLFHCRYRNGKHLRAVAWMANFVFGVLGLEFLLFRIYWYLTKVLYSTVHTAIEMHVTPPNYFIFNALVLTLYVMQVYWLKFITRFVWKVLIKREEIEPHKMQFRSTKEE